MDAVTYSDDRVIELVNRLLVPLKIPYDQQPLAGEFRVRWTPTIVVLDAERQEHHRTVGYLAPEEFSASLLVGVGKTRFDHGRLEEGLNLFREILAAYPESGFAPEATYYRGVSLFKKTHDPGQLRETYEELQTKYPASEWTTRAYPYKLL